MNKSELFKKLQNLKPEDAKKLNISEEEIKYLRDKILNDNLGLTLNFTEMDNEVKSNYILLEELPELAINPKEKNNNLLIEGDNYHALKALQKANVKVDIIYIDPPYNTGKEFVYKDDFGVEKVVGQDDAHKHSKWLSFMKKRLELAKELLSDEGVIFVSIDDNEQAYLKVLMDEIFGEENFVISGMVENNPKGRKNGTFFAVSSEYLLIYTKNISVWGRGTMEFNGRLDPEKKIHQDENGVKYTRGKRQLIGTNSNPEANKENFERSFHIFVNPTTREYAFINTLNKDGSINNKLEHFIPDAIHYEPRNKDSGEFNIVTYTKEKMSELIKSNMVLYFDNFIYEKEQNFESKFKNIFTKETTYGVDLKTETAGVELESILGEKSFSMPKNPQFISMILNLYPKKDAVVIDFFAGSGTTGQAVMQLNSLDDGCRRFILVTNNEMNGLDTEKNPEKGIARAITRERLFRVINEKGSKNESIKWRSEKSLKANSVKYLKVKLVDKFEGDFEEIDDVKKLYENEFDKSISISDFKE